MMKTKVLVLLFFCSTLTAFSQSLQHVQGEVLVRISSDYPIDNLIALNRGFRNQKTKLEKVACISEYMDIWQLRFDYVSIHETDFIESLRHERGVMMAQLNHKLSYRNIPNDPEFGVQWQYINDGANGGLVGADIDMDLAWDVATGGTTANGDTIVVCVVDDGLDPTHLDFEGNVWRNRFEIPGNGLDDDNNGYVDDYNGWNVSGQNDQTSQINWHGTPVAGIVGARGNNNRGVSGVSWNVKVMMVIGGGTTDAQAIAAYSFPLAHRMRYNATNGAEGAFVVATNSSWGLDFGQPSDAPLWCAFYDTLGVHGILSAGATANRNINVDVQGDLPTGCSSDFLISVTNMDRTDQKVTQAGYGQVTIDLGAFGENTWTTANGNTYGGFGGTSGATPHVAGTIGLLYSAPCPAIANLALGSPAEAALSIKSYILDGVDPNASLQNITVTGGRLNVNNSILLLMDNCGPCPPPSGINLQSVTDVDAELTWLPVDSATHVAFRYRRLGNTNWDTAANLTQNTHTLTGLTSCTEYEVQLQSICRDTVSDQSASFIFKTDGCCENPVFSFVQTTDSTITLQWNDILAAVSHDIHVTDSTSFFVTFYDVESPFVIVGREPCTTFYISISTDCDTITTNFSTPISVQTSGCGACIDQVYCPSSSEDASFEWISEVHVGSQSNLSGGNGGYVSFTDLNWSINKGEETDIRLVPGFQTDPFNEHWKIWIDYDQDGIFSNNDELAFDSDGVFTEAVTGQLTVPASAQEGLTRMRVTMKFVGGFDAESPAPCLNNFGFGEVEDYCVEIRNDFCAQPSNLDTVEVTTSSIALRWDDVSNPTAYELLYSADGSVTWESLTGIQTNTFLLDSLDDCALYHIIVNAICASGTSNSGDTLMVITDCSTSIYGDLNSSVQIRVYPNPLQTQFLYVDLTNLSGRSEDGAWKVIATDGRAILGGQLTGIDYGGQFRIDVSSLQSGVYALQLVDEQNRQWQNKIVVP